MRVEAGSTPGRCTPRTDADRRYRDCGRAAGAGLVGIGTDLLLEHPPRSPDDHAAPQEASRRTPRSSRWTSSGSTRPRPARERGRVVAQANPRPVLDSRRGQARQGLAHASGRRAGERRSGGGRARRRAVTSRARSGSTRCNPKAGPHDGQARHGAALTRRRARRPGGWRRPVDGRGAARSSRPRRCCVSRTVRSLNVVLPAMLRDTGLEPTRPRLRHGARLRHAPACNARSTTSCGDAADRPLRLARHRRPRRARENGRVPTPHRNVPADAAVGETVAIVPLKARGYVNERGAVARRRARLGVAAGTTASPRSPSAVVPRLDRPGARRELGLPTRARARARQRASLGRVRVSTRDGLGRRSRGVAGRRVEVTPTTLVPGALLARRTGDPARSPRSRRAGHPQDKASQAVVAILDPQPGDRGLDVAARPGGKSIATAERVAETTASGRRRDVQGARPLDHARQNRPLRNGGGLPVVADGRELALVGERRSRARRRALQRPGRAPAARRTAVAHPAC